MIGARVPWLHATLRFLAARGADPGGVTGEVAGQRLAWSVALTAANVTDAHLPVWPKPPSPRPVSPNVSTTSTRALATGASTS